MNNTWHGKKVTFTEAIRRFGRNRPQVYRILVAGALDPDWSDRLGGLHIESLAEAATDHHVAVLEGLIRDQAQLSGVLNTFCNLRLPLLGVEIIEDDINQRPNPLLLK